MKIILKIKKNVISAEKKDMIGFYLFSLGQKGENKNFEIFKIKYDIDSGAV